jgi:hypothetical protein
MQITGKIIIILPLQSGKGKNGDWKKQEFILETNDQYPKKILFSVWGNKIDSDQLVIGNIVQVDFDIESREYNSKWYTEAKVWKILVDGSSCELSSLDVKVDISDGETLPF